jgi:hypothetical protein
LSTAAPDGTEQPRADQNNGGYLEVLPVYAASDQDVCGVDMSLNNVQAVDI